MIVLDFSCPKVTKAGRVMYEAQLFLELGHETSFQSRGFGQKSRRIYRVHVMRGKEGALFLQLVSCDATAKPEG